MNERSELQQAFADRDHAREEREKLEAQLLRELSKKDADTIEALERADQITADLLSAREELATLKAELNRVDGKEDLLRAELARLQPYVQHKCALRTNYKWARIYHFENHDGDIDWPKPTCGDSDCEAWSAAGETGPKPPCTCGLIPVPA